jgi:hypothetical protein
LRRCYSCCSNPRSVADPCCRHMRPSPQGQGPQRRLSVFSSLQSPSLEKSSRRNRRLPPGVAGGAPRLAVHSLRARSTVSAPAWLSDAIAMRPAIIYMSVIDDSSAPHLVKRRDADSATTRLMPCLVTKVPRAPPLNYRWIAQSAVRLLRPDMRSALQSRLFQRAPTDASPARRMQRGCVGAPGARPRKGIYACLSTAPRPL